MFCISFSSADSSIKTEQPYRLDTVAKSKSFSVGPSDIKTAESILQFYKELRGGFINHHQLQQTYKDVGKKANFRPFKIWLSKLSQIERLNSPTSAIEYCKKLENKEFGPSVESKLNKQLIQTCHRYTLDLITKNIKKTKSLASNIKSYIDNHFTYFLSSANKRDFYRFIDKISSVESVHHDLSNLFSQQIIDLNLEIDNSLLSRIQIGPELTRFIQLKGIVSDETRKIFYHEVKDLIAQIYSHFEEGEKDITEEIGNLLIFVNSNKKYLPLQLTHERLLSLGRFLSRNKRYKDAQKVFTFNMNEAQEDLKQEATFQHLWTYLNDKEYNDAHKFVIQHDLLTNFSYLEPRLQFWIAFNIMKNGDNSSAISYYKKIIKANPLSYYAIMANKNIGKIKNVPHTKSNYYLEQLSENANGIVLSEKEMTEDTIHSLVRLKIWGMLDNRSFIQAEYDGLVHSKKQALVKKNFALDESFLRPNLSLLSSALLQESNNYLAAFRIIYNEFDGGYLNLSRTVLSQLFPRPFLAKIRDIASEQVDPIILLSLIRQESGFNPEARSRVGARGLMQLMPSTARTIRKKVTTDSLNNPTLNIKIGSKYFEYLYSKYEGNLVYTLSSYNAGESRVDRWRRQYFTSDSILHNIENIPFDETRKYVKLIFRNIFFYKMMHEDLKMVDSSKSNQLFDIALGFKR